VRVNIATAVLVSGFRAANLLNQSIAMLPATSARQAATAKLTANLRLTGGFTAFNGTMFL
jgi:hypothetical protein